MLDLDDFDIVWKDAQLGEFLPSVFSLVTVKDDEIVFDVTAGTEFMLQLMRELLQVNTITDGVMRLHGGHRPP